VALLLGFEFPKNFDRPYSAISLRDFWRRWHITLSRWLRDYVYIPLGGSRRGEVGVAVSVMVTMLVGGLWHGAGWTFVAWGGLHGLGQVLGRWRRRTRIARGLPSDPVSALAIARARILTFHLVCLGWVFFRAESFGSGFDVLGRLVSGWGAEAPLVTPLVVLAIGGMLLLQNLPRTPAVRLQLVFSRAGPVLQGAACAIVLFAITAVGPTGVAPFIYFRF
jgi:alginate O-acetyltransferase complex protein AlgI